jgi:hypothetical protein
MTTYSSKNIQNQETKVKQVEKPNIHGLRNELRARYPSSKFQTVYLSKNSFNGEYTVYYASKRIKLPFSQFCEQFEIDATAIEKEVVYALQERSDLPKSVNQMKANVLFDVGFLPKHAVLYKKIISDYAAKCSIPIDYAETLIRPVEWVRYANDTSKKIYKPAYLIGSHFFTPNSKNSKNELYTAKMPVYTVDNYLFPLLHLNDSKRDEDLLDGKEHFVLLEGQNDCNCFNYHFKDTIYFAVTVGGVKNWTGANVQLEYLRSLRPDAQFFTLFDNDHAGKTTLLPFATTVHWNSIFKVELKEGFDVCDAFQSFSHAKDSILSELSRVFLATMPARKILGKLGDYLSTVLENHNIPIDIAHFKNTIVISNTGSGKGRIIEQLCKKGINICVFPLNMVVEQMTARIKGAGCNVFAYHGTGPILESLSTNHAITTTYASFPKLVRKLYEKYGAAFLKEINILWDEFQNFTTSASPNFMLGDLNRCINLFDKFASFTGFTGTFVPNTHPFLASLSRFEIDIPIKKPILDMFVCDNTILSIIEKVRKHVANGEKVAILLNDKGAKLDKLVAGLKDIKIAVLNSDTKDSIDFQSIVKDEKVSDDVKVIISTTVLKEGANVLNEIDHVYIDSKRFNLYDIWQFINRFRTSIKTGMLEVHIMCTKMEAFEKVAAFDFYAEANKIREDNQSIIDTISKIHDAALKEKFLDAYKLMDGVPIYYNEIDNALEIDELYLNFLCYQKMTLHSYSSVKTFETIATAIGFEFKGIEDHVHTIDKQDIKDINLEITVSKEVRQLEYENILQDLKKKLEAENEGDFSKITVFEHIEKMKTVQKLTPIEKIVYEGLQNIVPFYDDAEKMIQDVEKMVPSPKKRHFSLLKRRLRARNFVQSDAMETKSEVTTVIQSIMANVMCGEIYISSELKDIVLSAMSGQASFQHIVKKITDAKRIDKVLNILEAFFYIKIGKSNCEMRYRLRKIDFYAVANPDDILEPVFDIF